MKRKNSKVISVMLVLVLIITILPVGHNGALGVSAANSASLFFDMGNKGPATGATKVLSTYDLYSDSKGYGWQSSSSLTTTNLIYREYGKNTSLPADKIKADTDVLADSVLGTVDTNFRVNVPNGSYKVEMYFFDYYARQFNISLNGATVESSYKINATTDQKISHNVVVNDGSVIIGFNNITLSQGVTGTPYWSVSAIKLIPASGPVTLMREDFESEIWYQSNSSYVSHSDTLMGGVTSSTLATKMLSFKNASTKGSVVFKITSPTQLKKLILNWSGRAISRDPNVPGIIDFLISNDNINYRSAKKYVGTTTGTETNFYNKTVIENFSQYVRGLTEFYLKIDMTSVTDTWTSLDFIEVVSDDSATEHTITFDSDGGAGLPPIFVDDGNLINDMPSTQKSGYAFVGWFTDKTYTTQFTGVNVKSSCTVYAKWLEKIIKPNGIILDEGFNELNTYTRNVNLIKSTNIKDGVLSSNYRGVIPSSTSVGTLIFDFDLQRVFSNLYIEYSGKVSSLDNSSARINFYVSTDNNTYTKIITEESNNGSTNFFLGDKCRTYVLPNNLNNSTKFYIKVELIGSNDLTFLDNIKIVTFEELGARKTVNFNSNGAGSIAPITTDIGVINLPTPPTKQGYIFKGWYLENDKFFNGANITGDITVSAKWANENPVLNGDINQYDTDGEFYYTDKFVQSKANTVLNGYYNNNMLIQQNQPINIIGTDTANEVKGILIRDKDSQIVAYGKAAVVNGKFKVELPAVSGSFDSHTLVIEGSSKIKYSNVLIGELWVTGGQSNMELAVKMMYNASDVMKTIDNSNLRFLHEPVRGDNGAEAPATPLYSTPSTLLWSTGCVDSLTAGMSAIGYIYAKNMYSNLNVPIGILDVAISGSLIEAWLSRDTINSNSFISNKLTNSGNYLTLEQFNSTAVAVGGRYNQMTAQYNKRIAPFAGIGVKGVIWYQGESNVQDVSDDYYSKALNVLIKEWSRTLTGSDNEQLPFIFIGLAAYGHGWEGTPLFNEQIYKTWQMNKEKSAMVYIGDLALYYSLPTSPSVTHPIHPIIKQPVGERCVTAAMGLVYGSNSEYMSPAFKNSTIIGDKIQVKFTNVGDGLKIKDGGVELLGFTIAGSDGTFSRAKAKIITRDTVEVYSPHISSPQTVAYAFTNYAMYSNLVNSINLPAISFRSKTTGTFTYYSSKEWSYTASPEIWLFNLYASYINPWQKNSTSVNKINSINVDLGQTIKDRFAVKATYNNAIAPVSFGITSDAISIEKKYNVYKKLSFTVHNKNDRAISFNRIQAKNGNNDYFANKATTIPANSSLEIPVDISTFSKADGSSVDGNTVLTSLTELFFEFTDNSQGELYISGIEFYNEDGKVQENVQEVGISDVVFENGNSNINLSYNIKNSLTSDSVNVVIVFAEYDAKNRLIDVHLSNETLLQNQTKPMNLQYVPKSTNAVLYKLILLNSPSNMRPVGRVITLLE